jgi:cbb3-type cytochrome oxidase subunit 3
MAWFIFIGDMLVMLFMTVLVVWVSAGANRETLDYSARIPLDDDPLPEPKAVKEADNHG